MAQLQYIYNNSDAQFNIPISGMNTIKKVEFKWSYQNVNPHGYQANLIKLGGDFGDFVIRRWENKFDIYWYKISSIVPIPQPQTDEIVTCTYDVTNSVCTWNGTDYQLYGTQNYAGNSMQLGGNDWLLTVYYIKMWDDNGNLIHYYVGWNEDNTIGMKDKLTDHFYSPSSGTFLGGPVEILPEDLVIGNKTVDSINIGGKDVVSIYDGATLLWEKPVTPQPTPPIVSNCVCFEALEAGAEVQLQKGSNLSTPQVYLYASTDNGQTFTRMERNQSFSMPNIGDKVYIYGNNTSMSSASSKYYSLIVNNKQVSVSGDLTRLLNPNGVTTLPDYAFNGLFQNSNGIVDASGLTIPVTTVGQYALHFMFAGCTTLQYAPTQLVATNLGKGCYSEMFRNCTSLITVPTLPATTLAEYCYVEMFSNCTSLTTAPALPALTMENYCYSQMFEGCSGLTTAPVLPALTLDTDCYSSMFRNCTSLNSVTCLATDISALDCTDSWLENVSSTGTFTKNPNMSNWPTGISGIPTGWTVQDANPMTQAEYVTTSYSRAAGTFIDTGIYPTIDTVFKVKYKPIATNDTCVVGFAQNGTPTGSGSDSNDYRLFDYASLTQGTFDFNSSRINGNLTADTDGYLYVEVGNNYIKDLNTGQTVTTGSTQSSMQTTTVPMYLDLSNSEQMHSLEIWEGQTKVYDGYAAHNGTDYGWYDAVGDTFTTQTYGGYTITGAL